MESFAESWELLAFVSTGWYLCVCPSSIVFWVFGLGNDFSQEITLSCIWEVDGDEACRDGGIFATFARIVDLP